MASHYDILGIAPGVTDAQVRAAYLGAVRAMHPDSTSTPGSDLSRIVSAYRSLRTAEGRDKYDRQLERKEYGRLMIDALPDERPGPSPIARIIAVLIVSITVLVAALLVLARWGPVSLPGLDTSEATIDTDTGTDTGNASARAQLTNTIRARAASDVEWVTTLHGQTALALYSDLCHRDAQSVRSRLQCSYCSTFDGEAWKQTGDPHFSSAANAARGEQCRRTVATRPSRDAY